MQELQDEETRKYRQSPEYLNAEKEYIARQEKEALYKQSPEYLKKESDTVKSSFAKEHGNKMLGIVLNNPSLKSMGDAESTLNALKNDLDKNGITDKRKQFSFALDVYQAKNELFYGQNTPQPQPNQEGEKPENRKEYFEHHKAKITESALSALKARYADSDFSDVSPSRYGAGWTAGRNATNANNKRTAEEGLMNGQHEYIKSGGKLPESYFEHVTSNPIYYQPLLGKAKSDSLGLSSGTGYFGMPENKKVEVKTAIWNKIKSQPIIKKLDRELDNAAFGKKVNLNGSLT